jgi:ADP-ribosylglycohydrolase
MWTINGAGATASFTFAAVDGAGTTGAARTYTINSLVTLPAIGLQLQASLSQGKALLQWETQTEVNTSFFTMQWSTDGVQFSNAGNRICAGNAYGQGWKSFLQ